MQRWEWRLRTETQSGKVYREDFVNANDFICLIRSRISRGKNQQVVRQGKSNSTMIYEPEYQNATQTCAFDWIHDGGCFYDVWVSRSLTGDTFFEIPQSGSWDFLIICSGIMTSQRINLAAFSHSRCIPTGVEWLRLTRRRS